MKISLILTPQSKDMVAFLKNLKNQTIKTFELIIVGNVYNTEIQDLINIYKQYFEIKYIKTNKTSLADMKNKALFEVSGDIITFPTVDTVYMPNTIERVISYLYDSEETICVCNDIESDLEEDDIEISSSGILNVVREDNFFINIKGRDIYLFTKEYKSNVSNIYYVSMLKAKGYIINFLYSCRIQTSNTEVNKDELKKYLKKELFLKKNFSIIKQGIKNLLKRGN